MELRHLRYFLAVAEQLNFTRAAKSLHISQPPLTQQIRHLEEQLGVSLFDRSMYRIQLTDAGKVFVSEVRRILMDVQRAVTLAQRAAAGAIGRVRVGFTESASFNPLVTSAFRDFRVAQPDVEMSLEEHPSTELAAALRDNRIDMAFLRPPLSDSDGLTVHIVMLEDMVVAIPRGNRLAKRKRLELRMLAEEQFILYPRAVRPGLTDAVVSACERAGFAPRVCQFAPQLSSTINLVAAGLGVSIVPQAMRGLQPRAVAYVPLLGSPIKAPLGVAHRTDERSAAVLNFVNMVGEVNERHKRGRAQRAELT